MIAHVVLPLPLNKTFSYSVPKQFERFAKPLSRVKVPLGNRMLTGFIRSVEQGENEEFKELAGILDPFPLIDALTFELCEWASQHYVAPIGVVLKYALPPKLQLARFLWVRALHNEARNIDGLAMKAAIALVGKRVLWEYHSEGLVEFHDSYTGSCFKTLVQAPPKGGYRPGLYIAGVEQRRNKYLSVIAERLDQGQNVLLLLPDYHVAGDYFYRHLAEAFGSRVVWHTSSQPKSRMEAFFRARSGKGCLILGNKSAVLLPMLNRGVIIVERPEEDEYRNEEAFHFHAVTLALKSAELNGTPILLGSASPPLDIVRLARETPFLVEKEQDLCLGRQVAEIPGDSRIRDRIPAELAAIVDATVRNNETIAIYTPRKDYAFRLYCLECRKPFLCPDCDTPLAYHKESDKLVCSACKKNLPYRERCEECGGSLVQFSSTGLEFLEETLSASLTENHLLRITGESLRKKDVRSLLQASRTTATVVIGTRILSRLYGLRVKRLVLMGQEEFLWIAGYRAHERIFQTFRNLVDALRPEEIFLIVGKKGLIDSSRFIDQDRFYDEELAKRKMAEFPPYARLFLIEVWRKGNAGERLIGRIVERINQEKLGDRMMGPIWTKKGGLHGKLVLRGGEHSFSSIFEWLYGMPGVRIEPDPPGI